MNKKKLNSEPNPTLVNLRDNKAKWNLPEYRREGYRNLHRIYSVLETMSGNDRIQSLELTSKYS